jgi:hypothetical protein
MSGDIVERLREEGLGWGIGPAGLCQEAAAEIERLTARCKALEEGLKPFAEIAGTIDSAAREHGDEWNDDECFYAKLGDLRRARTLTETDNG